MVEIGEAETKLQLAVEICKAEHDLWFVVKIHDLIFTDFNCKQQVIAWHIGGSGLPTLPDVDSDCD